LLTTNNIENNNDLKQLDSYFKDVTIVGMGESTHGTHEFFTMRHRVFRYLVENHDFNTFFLEADYANCLRVNNYIHGSEDNAIESVKSIDMWPWKTSEMVDLVEWMRTYNMKNPHKQLNFIGVDIQRYVETLTEIDIILKQYKLPITDSLIYQKMLGIDFFSVTRKEELVIYKKVDEQKKLISSSQFSKNDRYVFNTLIRHLNQIIDGKKYILRDRKMAKNIVYHLKLNSTIKGFFWAHNGHIANFYRHKKTRKKWNGSAGGNLKKMIADKYFSIGQEFHEGSFNSYYPDTNSTEIINGQGFTLGEVLVSQAIEGSFSYKYKYLKKPVLIDCISLPKKESIIMTSIGAVYYPETYGKPGSIARNNRHGKSAFDAIILINKSSPTHLLGNIVD
jgi:erythromycin esterase